ncbi:MAG: helix-turn-helix domain-containing protein [Candidatus Desulforudaceae bacterium]
MSFGERLKRLREEAEISREELADALKLTYSAVSKYEQDKRAPSHLMTARIANYFKVSADYLLGRTSDPTPMGIQDEPPYARLLALLRSTGDLTEAEQMLLMEDVADYYAYRQSKLKEAKDENKGGPK